MEENYLYILDYSDCTLNCLHLDNAEKKEEDFDNVEELIHYWGFNPDECSWMFSSVELDINHIVLPLK
jgi:hypothetical protein